MNASRREDDLEHLESHASGCDVTIVDETDESAMIAVQGPEARAIVASLGSDDAADARSVRCRPVRGRRRRRGDVPDGLHGRGRRRARLRSRGRSSAVGGAARSRREAVRAWGPGTRCAWRWVTPSMDTSSVSTSRRSKPASASPWRWTATASSSDATRSRSRRPTARRAQLVGFICGKPAVPQQGDAVGDGRRDERRDEHRLRASRSVSPSCRAVDPSARRRCTRAARRSPSSSRRCR